MNIRLQIAIIALVVTTMALAPSLVMNQSAEAKVIKCEDEKGKDEHWIKGCSDGWFNWDKCGTNYPHGSDMFYEGYQAGWKKGQASNPKVSCPNGRG